MFTDEGQSEYEKWAEWISDDNFQFSPDFVPDESTPQGAVDYYKYMLGDMVDFDAPGFTWPTGIGVNF